MRSFFRERAQDANDHRPGRDTITALAQRSRHTVPPPACDREYIPQPVISRSLW